MPDTGWVQATSASQNSDSSAVSWTGLVNVTVPGDGSFATASGEPLAVKDTRELQVTFPGMLPAASVIKGISLRCRVKKASVGGAGGAATEKKCSLFFGGMQSEDRLVSGNITNTDAFADRERGGPDDTWGLALSPADGSSASLQAIIVYNLGKGAAVNVSSVYARVYYDLHHTMHIQDGGIWKPGQAYVRDGGIWKPGKLMVRNGGIWK